MIPFQKGYTTPEQSERLLKLGLPADSADMYYKHTLLAPYIFSDGVLFSVYSKAEDIIPCWSVGRLIEIFAKCKMYGEENKMIPLELYADEINSGLVDFLIDVMYNYNDLDFSKLEE